jgi:hypothetical protein
MVTDVHPTKKGNMILDNLRKLLVSFGSLASIGFGLWHFFVPKLWNWYAYIDVAAKELFVAIRAINVFFSLSLVLFGVMNLLFIMGDKANRYSILVLLGTTCILWLTRVVLQIIYPQGSMNPVLQYGMLAAFIVIFLCYSIALWLTITSNTIN